MDPAHRSRPPPRPGEISRLPEVADGDRPQPPLGTTEADGGAPARQPNVLLRAPAARRVPADRARTGARPGRRGARPLGLTSRAPRPPSRRGLWPSGEARLLLPGVRRACPGSGREDGAKETGEHADPARED